MKTALPEAINTIEEAKAFLFALTKNGESFHPEDDAHEIYKPSKAGIPGEATLRFFTPPEADKLNKLMEDIYNLPGNVNVGTNLAFDPCGYILELDIEYVANYHTDGQYTMADYMNDDQPTTCPTCGARTEFKDYTDIRTGARYQVHTCLNNPEHHHFCTWDKEEYEKFNKRYTTTG